MDESSPGITPPATNTSTHSDTISSEQTVSHCGLVVDAQDNIWENGNNGYTPLLDNEALLLMERVHVSRGPITDETEDTDTDDDNDENDNNMCNEYKDFPYQSCPSVVEYSTTAENGNVTSAEEESSSNDGGGDDDSDDGVKESDFDFHAIAQQALSSLDLDYRRTVALSSSSHPHTSKSSESPNETPQSPPLPPIRLLTEDFGTNFFPTNFDESISDNENEISNYNNHQNEDDETRVLFFPVDAGAVRAAVQAIGAKHPALNIQLANWVATKTTTTAAIAKNTAAMITTPTTPTINASDRATLATRDSPLHSVMVPLQHSIIPSHVLDAFRHKNYSNNLHDRIHINSSSCSSASASASGVAAASAANAEPEGDYAAAEENEHDEATEADNAVADQVAVAMNRTAALTRSATVADALHRLHILESCHKEEEEGGGYLEIHILGCDDQECASHERIREQFTPLVTWISSAQFSPRHVRIVLVGPNLTLPIQNQHHQLQQQQQQQQYAAAPTMTRLQLIPSPNHRHHHHLKTQNNSQSKLQTAEVVCVKSLYHEFLQYQQQSRDLRHNVNGTNNHGNNNNISNNDDKDKDMDSVYLSPRDPHLLVAFNAGIWGYAEWPVTLQWLINHRLNHHKRSSSNNRDIRSCSSSSRSSAAIPLVVTAYTLQEAEDDADVVDQIRLQRLQSSKSDSTSTAEDVRDGVEMEVVWASTENAFGSHVQRATATAPPHSAKIANASIRSRTYRDNAAWACWRL